MLFDGLDDARKVCIHLQFLRTFVENVNHAGVYLLLQVEAKRSGVTDEFFARRAAQVRSARFLLTSKGPRKEMRGDPIPVETSFHEWRFKSLTVAEYFASPL